MSFQNGGVCLPRALLAHSAGEPQHDWGVCVWVCGVCECVCVCVWCGVVQCSAAVVNCCRHLNEFPEWRCLFAPGSSSSLRRRAAAWLRCLCGVCVWCMWCVCVWCGAVECSAAVVNCCRRHLNEFPEWRCLFGPGSSSSLRRRAAAWLRCLCGWLITAPVSHRTLWMGTEAGSVEFTLDAADCDVLRLRSGLLSRSIQGWIQVGTWARWIRNSSFVSLSLWWTT